MDGPAALRPIEEVSGEISRLTYFGSTAELASAVESIARAVERALHIHLRANAPADATDGLPADRLVQALRRRDLISLEVAGTVHELMAAAERARAGATRPADADLATRAVSRIRAELGTEHRASSTPADPADESSDAEPASPILPEQQGRWMAWLAAGLAVLGVVALAFVLADDGGPRMDDAVQAFRAGRLDSARVGFERVLEDRPSDVSARLFLARIHRRQGRPQDAAELLRRAVELEPEDADVRRELGHLFMDLGSTRSAIAQYERSLEYDAEDPLTWIAYIRALRAADDPRAARMLDSAPAEVRAALGGPG